MTQDQGGVEAGERDAAHQFVDVGKFGLSLRMNLRRAGVLKKRSTTSTVVPTGWAAGLTVTLISRPSAWACQASLCSAVREVKVRRETELMEASASRESPGC